MNKEKVLEELEFLFQMALEYAYSKESIKEINEAFSIVKNFLEGEENEKTGSN